MWRNANYILASARLVCTSSRARAPKEVIECVSNFSRTFEVGEVPAVFECYQLSLRNCTRDMPGDVAGDEIMIAGDNQGRYAEGLQLGQQIVAIHLPGFAHQPVLNRACLYD